jgi:hypothetical protein
MKELLIVLLFAGGLWIAFKYQSLSTQFDSLTTAEASDKEATATSVSSLKEKDQQITDLKSELDALQTK